MNLEPWHDLFLAAAGAGSALAGLIIVAISANITTILAIPSMTSRAATTVAVLLLIVVVACAGLVPDQPARAFGVEIVLASATATALAVRSAAHIIAGPAATDALAITGAKVALGVAPTTGMMFGGVVVGLDVEAGLYLTAAAIVTGFATAVTNAWVLLVEILR